MKRVESARVKIILCILFLSIPALLVGCATTTPLMTAAEQGNVALVNELLAKGAPIDEKGPFDSTALRQATEFGRIEVIKVLLDKGADINMGDAGGDTPLMIASQKGYTDIVRLLLDRGAKPDQKNFNGWTALGYVSKPDIAALLLGRGANINEVNTYGATPLSSAAMLGRKEVARFMIDKGADLDDAVSRCKDTLDRWSKLSYMKDRMHQPRQCIDFLTRIKTEKDEAKRREQEMAQTRTLNAQKAREMKEIVREVMAESGRTGKQPASAAAPAVASDIEKLNLSSAEKIMGENDLAVIIGIEGYQSLPKSDYSYDDARLVRDYARVLGFRDRNIEFLTDEKATLSGIAKTVDIWLRNKAKPNSRVLVYYSGHGAPDPSSGEAYLVPYDGDPNYLSVTGYSLKRLYENIGRLQAAEAIVVLDACFSGAGGRSVLAKGARPLVILTGGPAVAKNMAVISATQGSQISTSSPERGHGVFTYHFLKAIKEGKRNVAEIYETIRPLVEDDAKQLNVQQSPSVSPAPEKLKGRFSLRK